MIEEFEPSFGDILCEETGIEPSDPRFSQALRDAVAELDEIDHYCVFGGDPRRDTRNLEAALADLRRFQKSLSALDRWPGINIEGDGALIKRLRTALNTLEPLLVATAEKRRSLAEWRASGSRGSGRPPRRSAYDVAGVAARFYREVTGKDPTYSTEGTTPYKRMLEQLFLLASIKADPRRPAEWAIGQNRAKSVTSDT